MSNRTLISWSEFREKEFDQPKWLINPYVPSGGAIVFFWGETSTGKSPLGWHLASAVGRGTNFFGLPANAGKVLYIELDTPEMLVHDRVKKLEPVENVDFLFLPPLSVPEVAPPDQAMLDKAARNNYDMVIVNTLRKSHNLDDKEPVTPKLVYSYFQAQFPGSSLIFVHHTKKPQAETQQRLKDNFSGAMNWLNDAQVGIALTRFEDERQGINVRLNHEKSQVSLLHKPLGLMLHDDGAHMSCPKYEQLLVTYEMINCTDLRGTHFDKALAAKLSCSVSHAYELRGLVEDGMFPGTSWLGTKKGEDAK